MRLLLYTFRASWRMVLIASLAGGVGGVATIMLIAAIHARLSGEIVSPALVAWAFAGLCLVALLSQCASQLLIVRLSQDAMRRLSMDLCQQILKAPLRRLEETGNHRLLTALTNDVFVVTRAINALPFICVSMATLICGFAYMFWLSPLLFGGMIVFLILGVTTYRVGESWGNRYLAAARADHDTLMRHINSLIAGTKELKLHRPRRDDFVKHALAASHQQLRDHQVTGYSVHSIAISWGRLLFFVAIGLVLFVWPMLQPIDSAALVGYVLTILYLTTPLDMIMGLLPVIAMANISMKQIESLELTIGSAEGEASPPPAPRRWQRLEMVGVTHTYYREREGANFRLGPIDLTLEPGELVFVVGGNGSGKTTLAKLLTGLYAPEEGDILIDGEPVAEHNREAYRQRFTAVFAEAVLFESLLGIGQSEVDAQAREYLDLLHLDHVVTIQEGVFSTTELSKGQRKRLALLTAYLEDRPIYVFDEWAADQDPLFKDVFYRRLLPALRDRGKAVLVISHDDRYFAEADRVIALCDGQIIHGDWDLARSLAEVGRPHVGSQAAVAVSTT